MIVVAGSKDFTLGFRLAGIKKVISSDNIEEKADELLNDKNVDILVLWDEDVKRFRTRMKDKIGKVTKPIIVSVGKTEEEDLREKIKKAIGLDLYKEKKEEKA